VRGYRESLSTAEKGRLDDAKKNIIEGMIHQPAGRKNTAKGEVKMESSVKAASSSGVEVSEDKDGKNKTNQEGY